MCWWFKEDVFSVNHLFTDAFRYDVLVNIHQLCTWTSLVAQTVKRLPTMQETRVQSLSREDLLEKAMATHSRILGQRSLVGYSPWGKKHLLTPHHNDVAWLWQIQFLQLLPLDTDFKW